MVLVTSVFLVELLCVIVPCNPRYRLPDLSPDPHKLEYSHSSQYIESTKQHGNFWNQFAHKEGHYDGAAGSLFPDIFDTSRDPPLYKHLPFVRTHSGDIQGYYMKVVGGREINAFEGIPYGEPPKLFRSPVPKAPWKEILRAHGEAEPCLQYNVPRLFRVLGKPDMDCLFLNVYTPKLPTEYNSKPKLPVIVFIHGGGFFFGSTRAYGPSYFMQKDVVVCSLQYRLGVLGFMSTGDLASTGNWGLKDQALALKWIHENVEFFGGDPNRVTIMGQSAGSAFVNYHMLSTRSRPYFHRGVSLSGVALNYWAIHTPAEAKNITSTLANLVGCPTHDSFEMVECLRNTNPIKLVAKTPMFLDDWPYPSNAFRPVVEPLEGNPDPFLTDSPLAIYQKNEVAKIPWIVTTVSGEGYSFLLFPFITFAFQKVLRKNWYKLAPDLVDVDNMEGVDFNRVTDQVTKFYFKDVPPEKAPIHNYAKIITDRTFLTGIYRAAQAHSQVAPTYSYIFDFNGQYNAINNYGYPSSQWGVGHAEDVFYIFNSSTVYQGFKRGDPEFKISQLMINLFVNFAAKGEPLYTTEEGKDIQVWSPHKSPKQLKFFKIGKKIRMIRDPFRKRIQFWDQLCLPDIPTEQEVLYHYYPSNQHINIDIKK